MSFSIGEVFVGVMCWFVSEVLKCGGSLIWFV